MTVNLRLGRMARLFAPGFGTCHRCDTPWRFVEDHVTYFTPHRGCFPLCQKCWRDLGTPAARLPYYRQLIIGKWHQPELWSYVEAAVLVGK